MMGWTKRKVPATLRFPTRATEGWVESLKKEFMMRRTIVLASLFALGAGVALAQGSVIEQRKAEMKAMGAAAGAMSKMMKGEIPFDLAAVQKGLETIGKNAKNGPSLFPAGSDKGDTKAQADIWLNKAKFDGIFVKLAEAAPKAAGAIKDEASFKAEIGQVLGSCGACHKEFRGQ